MRPLFFDTETTGLYKYKLAPDSPEQPTLVQLAAILDNEEGETAASLSVIVACDIAIPHEASQVHGITKEYSEQYGISPIAALALFHNLVAKADYLVAHNISYDLAVLKTAYARLGKSDEFGRAIATKPFFCTKELTTDICKIPAPSGRFGYKWPRLEEAYRAVVDPNGFEGAHEALADTRACREVFYALQRTSRLTEPETSIQGT